MLRLGWGFDNFEEIDLINIKKIFLDYFRTSFRPLQHICKITLKPLQDYSKIYRDHSKILTFFVVFGDFEDFRILFSDQTS